MSSQTEKGFTTIPNNVLEALIAFSLPPAEMRCLLLVIRKTAGYNKQFDWIANSQFVAATGLQKSNVCRAIRSLVAKNIVVKNDNRTKPTYGFNKDFETWGQLSKMTTETGVSESTTAVVKNDNQEQAETTGNQDDLSADNSEQKNNSASVFSGEKSGGGGVSKTTPTKETVLQKKSHIRRLRLIASGKADACHLISYMVKDESKDDLIARATAELAIIDAVG